MQLNLIDFASAGLNYRNAWTDLVQSCPESGFMQSLEWAEFKRNQGLSILHLGVLEGENLIAGAIFYCASENGAGFLVAPHGPVLPWHDSMALPALELLLKAARRWQTNDAVHNMIGLRVEPLLAPPPPDLLLEFARAPISLLPRETVVVNVAPCEEDILQSMKPKGRYNVRLAGRKGVIVRSGSKGEVIDVFYPLLRITAGRDNFSVEPASFFVHLANTLFDNKLAQLLIAEEGGEILGGLIQIIYGKKATYLYGASSNSKRNLMTGYALQWEAIKRAKAAGCTSYDLYGFDQFCSPRNPYGRFSNFKSMFGGKVERYIGAQDYYFIDELADTVINALKNQNSV